MEIFNSNNDPQVTPEVAESETALAVAERMIEELKEANRQKDEFVSLATHQIRGPLGAVKGYVSLLLEGDYGEIPDGMREPLNIVLTSMDSLNKTVNDFLDVSRIEQGEMRYYRKDFDIVHLANEAVNEMRKTIHAAGLELKLNIREEPLMVHGDKAKLKHVLLNLIDNACKYTKKGRIEISLQKSADGKAVFCVRDSGMGIRKETLPLLFQKFKRCSEADKNNAIGTGLGLYIAKKMVEANNGKVWAESEGEGKGSQFYVEVPGL